MIGSSDLSLFVAALVAVYILPGPDMALVMSHAAAHGRRAGWVTALGLALARTLHVAFAGLGLAALLKAHPAWFAGARWLGAGYLGWMAWSILRSDPGLRSASLAGPPGARAALRQGFLTNLLNPKALMFCAVLLPQFIRVEAGQLAVQYLVLGAILVVLGLAFDFAHASAARRIAVAWSEWGRGGAVAKWVAATVLALAALRLAAFAG